jgi:hypothetical protein
MTRNNLLIISGCIKEAAHYSRAVGVSVPARIDSLRFAALCIAEKAALTGAALEAYLAACDV